MEYFIQTVRKAGIFLMVAKILLQLIPSKEYEKYIQFLLDLILIMILFLPIVSGVMDYGKSDISDIFVRQNDDLQQEIMEWEGVIQGVIAENYVPEEGN